MGRKTPSAAPAPPTSFEKEQSANCFFFYRSLLYCALIPAVLFGVDLLCSPMFVNANCAVVNVFDDLQRSFKC